jgi:hypothetical protein
VNTVVEHEGALHAAGLLLGGATAARWDGAQWVYLPETTSGEVFTLASFGGAMYAGGSIFSIGSVSTPTRLAKWADGAWSHAADPSPMLTAGTSVLAAAPFGGRLAVGGQAFGYRTTGATSAPVRSALMAYTGGEWQAFARGLDGAALDIIRWGDDVVLAGPFRVAGGRRVNGVTRWDGTEFHPMGQGLYSNTATTIGEIASDLEVGPDGLLYVCGLFTASDPGPPARTLDGVARWDGTLWRRTAAPGAHPTGQMYDFAVFNNQLFVTGNGAITGANGVLAYTGTAWQGTGWPLGTAPFCAEPFGGTLYVGPHRWTGTTFPFVTGGPQSMIDLREFGGRFFGLADGAFPSGSSCVGELRGGAWAPIGAGLISSLSNSLSGSLNWYHGDLIAARGFSGINPTARVVRWNGVSWQAISGDPDTLPPGESGLSRASATMLDGDVLWVTGLFLNAGGVPSPYVARYEASAGPEILSHPLGVRVCDASPAVFSVQATPGASLRWRMNGTPITDGQTLPSGGVATGATTATLTIGTGGFTSSGWTIDCVATTPCGSAVSAAARLDACCEPDVNGDGNVDQDDVAYLVNVLAGGANPTGIDPDLNRDGNADQEDVSALVGVVAGGPCP